MTITSRAIENFRVCGRKRDLLTRTMMRRPSDARKKEARGGLRKTLIMSMKSSSLISSLVLIDNRQTVTMVDRAMLHNKTSKVLGSILIRSGTVVKKSRVMGWNFMEKMYM
jgi:hypothetical protein